MSQGEWLADDGASWMLEGQYRSVTEYGISSYRHNSGSVGEVGLYNAVYAFCGTYLGVVFTSIDNDYFPKLSGIGENHTERNSLVNNQIEIILLMLTPLLVGLLVFVPIILPLLYSAKFAASAVMVRYVVFFMFFRAFILPMSYITLSKGDSLWFLAIELIYDVIFVSFVIIGFRFWGLKGCGIALALSAFSEMLLVGIFVRQKYRVSLSRDTFKMTSIMFLCSLSAFACAE